MNNRFRDLRNQLALAYWGDPTGWSEKLRLENDIETVFRNAQTVYARWSKLPGEQRTTAPSPTCSTTTSSRCSTR